MRDAEIIVTIVVRASGDHAENRGGLFFARVADAEHRRELRRIGDRERGEEGDGTFRRHCLQEGNAAACIAGYQCGGEGFSLLFNHDVAGSQNKLGEGADRTRGIDIKSGTRHFPMLVKAPDPHDSGGFFAGKRPDDRRDFCGERITFGRGRMNRHGMKKECAKCRENLDDASRLVPSQ